MYDENGMLSFLEDEFDSKEDEIKFEKDFNYIRLTNYKKHYGKKTKYWRGDKQWINSK